MFRLTLALCANGVVDTTSTGSLSSSATGHRAFPAIQENEADV